MAVDNLRLLREYHGVGEFHLEFQVEGNIHNINFFSNSFCICEFLTAEENSFSADKRGIPNEENIVIRDIRDHADAFGMAASDVISETAGDVHRVNVISRNVGIFQ